MSVSARTTVKTLKVGETYSFSAIVINYEAGPVVFTTGSSIVVTDVSCSGNDIKVNVTIEAVSSGYSSICVMDFRSGKSSDTYIFNVVDVVDIDIAPKVDLTTGESYTYNTIVTDAEATTTLTWNSSNTAVATVNASGTVTAVGPGRANITCTATNGVSAQSLVTVSPLLVESVTLDARSQEMNVGESVQLQSAILPANASSATVMWMSTNENIAQVDDSGNVTAIGPGYCSIFCIADDSSRKFAKCLIHVKGTASSRADVNGDGHVSVSDAVSVVNVILNQ